MTILYLLIPIAIVFLIVAVAFFFWAIRNDQYSDLKSPALKIVIDDHQTNKKSISDTQEEKQQKNQTDQP